MVKVTVNTAPLQARFNKYKTNLRSHLQAEMPKITKAVLDDVAQRTPTPDEEYYAIMGVHSTTGMASMFRNKGLMVSRAMVYGMKTSYADYPTATVKGRTHRIGIGNPGSGTYHGQRLMSSKSLKPFAFTGTRIHFIRDPGLWLKDLVYDYRTYSYNASGLKVRAGNVVALEMLSKFSWQNFSYRKGEFVHTLTTGVWRWFEYGAHNTVKPRPYGPLHLLRPNDNPNDAFYFMNKSYPRHNMYTGFSKLRIQPMVVSIARSVKF